VRARLATLPQHLKVLKQQPLDKRTQLRLSRNRLKIAWDQAQQQSNIDQERELFKAEYAKLEDEVSLSTNSLSKLGDEILEIRKDMTKLSSTLLEELAEFKNILLSMSETKNAPSPRRKTHRRSQKSDSASASSNDEKILDSDTSGADKNKGHSFLQG
jgi:uncharacterized membrane-anchored protein YhcB (DUF1043 family)